MGFIQGRTEQRWSPPGRSSPPATATEMEGKREKPADGREGERVSSKWGEDDGESLKTLRECGSLS